MNEICGYESIITSCAVSGIWNQEAVHHLSMCPDCRELVQLVEATRGLSVEEELRPLPDPDVLWLTAQIMNEQDNWDRVRWRVLLAEICSSVSISFCALLAFKSKMGLRLEGAIIPFQRLVPPPNDLFSVTLASFALALAIMGISFFIHPLLSDD